jgi:hypothetical protein
MRSILVAIVLLATSSLPSLAQHYHHRPAPYYHQHHHYPRPGHSNPWVMPFVGGLIDWRGHSWRSAVTLRSCTSLQRATGHLRCAASSHYRTNLLLIMQEPGHKSRAICHYCQRLVDVTFLYRDLKVKDRHKMVRQLLVGVCDQCGESVSIPAQNTPKIREQIG